MAAHWLEGRGQPTPAPTVRILILPDVPPLESVWLWSIGNHHSWRHAGDTPHPIDDKMELPLDNSIFPAGLVRSVSLHAGR